MNCLSAFDKLYKVQTILMPNTDAITLNSLVDSLESVIRECNPLWKRTNNVCVERYNNTLGDYLSAQKNIEKLTKENDLLKKRMSELQMVIWNIKNTLEEV